MDWIFAHWDDLLLIVTGTVTVASVIVKLTPSQKDDEALSWVVKLLKTLALTPK